MLLAQKRQGDVLTLPPHPQLLDEGPQRMSRHDDVDGAIASDHEQARRLLPPPEHRQQIEGRMVAPVEVLEHQQNGRRGRQRLQGLGHLAQHPLVGDPERRGGRRLAVDPRQLRQPCRSVAPENTDDPLGPGFAQQSPERFEDRQIRLRRAVVFEARTARDRQLRLERGARQQCVDHRRLADTGLTGKEHELALAADGAREPVRKLREHSVAPDRRAAWINRCRSLTGTGPDESVAPARHVLDEGRRRRIVAERAANLQDGDLENAVADVGLRPPRSQQLLFEDYLPAVFHQPA